MIEVYEKKVAGIPLIELVDSQLSQKSLPLVIFYHGWTNVKESVLIHGYEIAKQGFRVLLPEALYHGGRHDNQPLDAHLPDFLKIIQKNVTEFPKLLAYYSEAGLVNPQKIGVSGLSMGGITTCALMATYEQISGAVCLMGTPNMLAFMDKMLAFAEEINVPLPADLEEELLAMEPIDLARHPEKIAGRPFHFWHGTADDTVPYELAYEFYTEMKKQEFGKNLTFTTTADEHRVPFAISQETAQFFKKHLSIN